MFYDFHSLQIPTLVLTGIFLISSVPGTLLPVRQIFAWLFFVVTGYCSSDSSLFVYMESWCVMRLSGFCQVQHVSLADMIS